MVWAQHLKRVFNVDITLCNRCRGAFKIISYIEDPAAIKKILDHLAAKSAAVVVSTHVPEPRAPPLLSLF